MKNLDVPRDVPAGGVRDDQMVHFAITVGEKHEGKIYRAGPRFGQLAHVDQALSTIVEGLARDGRHVLPITCDNNAWVPIRLIPLGVSEATCARYSKFCPVYSGSDLIAVLLR